MSDITSAWNLQDEEVDWIWASSVLVEPLDFFGAGEITFEGSGDIQFGGDLPATDLAAGADLQTAILISLFTDRRAEDSDVIPDGSADRRGWWGDAGQNYRIGSRLWLLRRAKQIPATLVAAKAYCTEALAWLLADQVAAKIDVAVSFIKKGTIGIVITLFDQAGGVIAAYGWAWAGLS